MNDQEIRTAMEELRHRIALLERGRTPGLEAFEAVSQSCCARSMSSHSFDLDEQGQFIRKREAGPRVTARSSIDASRNDNSFLGCVYSAYSVAGYNPSSHWSTAEAFSNVRAVSADVGIIVGHGMQGLIITGTGQKVDGVDKYMAAGNQSNWSPHASPGIPGYRLVLFGCEVAGGAAGWDFISRVANVVRKQVGAYGSQQRGPCPLHGSTAGTSRCFSANLERHTFHCFKCGRSGNALELWAQATRQSIYDAAVDLCRRLNILLPLLPPAPRHREEEPVASPSSTCTMESN